VPGLEPDTISKYVINIFVDFKDEDVPMITIDDPQMYTKPFTIKVTHVLQADTDILEYFCNENEKDRGHMGK
jgi:hypothetical protein